MNWCLLFLAGILEVVWVIALKMSDNFSKLLPASIFVITIIGSFVLLNFAIRTLPIGLAYAVWTGMGAAGAVIAGIILFKEPCTFWHLFFLAMIIIGLVGIKFVSPE
jgi:quaternary ammonium compound-resistance protein SugE